MITGDLCGFLILITGFGTRTELDHLVFAVLELSSSGFLCGQALVDHHVLSEIHAVTAFSLSGLESVTDLVLIGCDTAWIRVSSGGWRRDRDSRSLPSPCSFEVSHDLDMIDLWT